ncbi:MAG: adenylate/guanylate cyclase domain-containing protein [Chloroflexi bacterium]|nr:MAG: adenylate/guanylate cyclase domain-containing protein [Chloroflexota bacterium]MBL1194275.1 adenylate/guanylate cyclase domain-containing protein [Chloroflexota bacterium]NOH11565.1 adenylate/guanylate cyclase domain-containing protein [Chloroflexota bacterium]
MSPRQSERSLSTILFTDIVSSTEKVLEKGDNAWVDFLEKHNDVVREQLDRFNGKEINTTGDGFVASFNVPLRAIQCAVAIAESVKVFDIEVRCGIHTGEVQLVDDTMIGIGVHTAARVIGEAGPSEVLVTITVRDLVEGSGVEFKELGRYELKGIPGKRTLYSVNLDTVPTAEELETVRMSGKEVERILEKSEALDETPTTNIMVVDAQTMARLDYGTGSFYISKKEVVLGRGPGADVDLTELDKNKFVSKRHAVILHEGDDWMLQCDPESSNPTHLNGELLPKGEKRPLNFGDKLLIADVALDFKPAL